MGKIQGDIVVIQALDDIAVQAVGIGAELHTGQHLGALQRHAARHNKADIAGAENDHPAADHVALHIDIALCRPCGKDAGRPVARNGNGSAGAVPAAHGQHHSPGLQLLVAIHGIDAADPAVGGDLHHHGIQHHFRLGLPQQLNKTPGVFGTGQFLLKAVQAKPIVDTLIEDAAQLFVPLDDQDFLGALFAGGAGGSQAGGSAADDNDIVFFHWASPPFSALEPVLVSPHSSQLPSSSISTCSLGRPSSRAMISCTRGPQKPP